MNSQKHMLPINRNDVSFMDFFTIFMARYELIKIEKFSIFTWEILSCYNVAMTVNFRMLIFSHMDEWLEHSHTLSLTLSAVVYTFCRSNSCENISSYVFFQFHKNHRKFSSVFFHLFLKWNEKKRAISYDIWRFSFIYVYCVWNRDMRGKFKPKIVVLWKWDIWELREEKTVQKKFNQRYQISSFSYFSFCVFDFPLNKSDF